MWGSAADQIDWVKVRQTTPDYFLSGAAWATMMRNTPMDSGSTSDGGEDNDDGERTSQNGHNDQDDRDDDGSHHHGCSHDSSALRFSSPSMAYVGSFLTSGFLGGLVGAASFAWAFLRPDLGDCCRPRCPSFGGVLGGSRGSPRER